MERNDRITPPAVVAVDYRDKSVLDAFDVSQWMAGRDSDSVFIKAFNCTVPFAHSNVLFDNPRKRLWFVLRRYTMHLARSHQVYFEEMFSS
jgi:hypothetical protein